MAGAIASLTGPYFAPQQAPPPPFDPVWGVYRRSVDEYMDDEIQRAQANRLADATEADKRRRARTAKRNEPGQIQWYNTVAQHDDTRHPMQALLDTVPVRTPAEMRYEHLRGLKSSEMRAEHLRGLKAWRKSIGIDPDGYLKRRAVDLYRAPADTAVAKATAELIKLNVPTNDTAQIERATARFDDICATFERLNASIAGQTKRIQGALDGALAQQQMNATWLREVEAVGEPLLALVQSSDAKPAQIRSTAEEAWAAFLGLIAAGGLALQRRTQEWLDADEADVDEVAVDEADVDDVDVDEKTVPIHPLAAVILRLRHNYFPQDDHDQQKKLLWGIDCFLVRMNTWCAEILEGKPSSEERIYHIMKEFAYVVVSSRSYSSEKLSKWLQDTCTVGIFILSLFHVEVLSYLPHLLGVIESDWATTEWAEIAEAFAIAFGEEHSGRWKTHMDPALLNGLWTEKKDADAVRVINEFYDKGEYFRGKVRDILMDSGATPPPPQEVPRLDRSYARRRLLDSGATPPPPQEVPRLDRSYAPRRRHHAGEAFGANGEADQVYNPVVQSVREKLTAKGKLVQGSAYIGARKGSRRTKRGL